MSCFFFIVFIVSTEKGKVTHRKGQSEVINFSADLSILIICIFFVNINVKLTIWNEIHHF